MKDVASLLSFLTFTMQNVTFEKCFFTLIFYEKDVFFMFDLSKLMMFGFYDDVLFNFFDVSLISQLIFFYLNLIR